MTLRQLRKTSGLNQTQAASALGITQCRISHMEAKLDQTKMSVETLNNFVKMCGGELLLSVRINGKRHSIQLLTHCPQSRHDAGEKSKP